MVTACRWCTNFSLPTFSFAPFPLPFSQAFSVVCHLASINKNEHHTNRLLCKNALGLQAGTLFFFLAWPQTWPSSFRKDLALLLPTLGIPTQRACSWYLAFPFLVTPGNHLLGQVSVPETQWLTWFYTRGILQEFYIRGIQESPTLVSEGDLSCLGSSWLSAGCHEPFSRKMIIYAISISQTLACIWISRRAC